MNYCTPNQSIIIRVCVSVVVINEHDSLRYAELKQPLI